MPGAMLVSRHLSNSEGHNKLEHYVTYGYGDPMATNYTDLPWLISVCILSVTVSVNVNSNSRAGRPIPLPNIPFLTQHTQMFCYMFCVPLHMLADMYFCSLVYFTTEPTMAVPTSIADLQMLFPSALVTRGIQNRQQDLL